MSNFERVPGSVTAVAIWEDCTHRWWQKISDWLHLQWHPEGHVLYFQSLLEPEEVQMEFTANGIFHFDLDKPKTKPCSHAGWCACEKYRVYYDSEQDEKH